MSDRILCVASGFTSLMAGNQSSGVNRPLGDFRCSQNEPTGQEMRLSRSFLRNCSPQQFCGIANDVSDRRAIKL